MWLGGEEIRGRGVGRAWRTAGAGECVPAGTGRIELVATKRDIRERGGAVPSVQAACSPHILLCVILERNAGNGESRDIGESEAALVVTVKERVRDASRAVGISSYLECAFVDAVSRRKFHSARAAVLHREPRKTDLPACIHTDSLPVTGCRSGKSRRDGAADRAVVDRGKDKVACDCA